MEIPRVVPAPRDSLRACPEPWCSNNYSNKKNKNNQKITMIIVMILKILLIIKIVTTTIIIKHSVVSYDIVYRIQYLMVGLKWSFMV